MIHDELREACETRWCDNPAAKPMLALLDENARLRAALRDIEAHHVDLNQRAGRPEDRSQTLRIARRALEATDTDPPLCCPVCTQELVQRVCDACGGSGGNNGRCPECGGVGSWWHCPGSPDEHVYVEASDAS